MNYIKPVSLLIFSFLFFIGHANASDKPDGVVDQFKQALKDGDKQTIETLLSKDVLIYEGGGVERSLKEYQSHHLNSDIKFSKAVEFVLSEREVIAQGKLAIISSRYKVDGTYKDKTIDMTMNETIVAEQATDTNWKIIRIHWSN